MTQSFRLENVGLINRDKKLSFKFNGVTYYGYEGDTLASALIANGIHLVGRSFKYHRPRGFFGAGVDEPYAIVQLYRNGETEPNVKATEQELFEGGFLVQGWMNLMQLFSYIETVRPNQMLRPQNKNFLRDWRQQV